MSGNRGFSQGGRGGRWPYTPTEKKSRRRRQLAAIPNKLLNIERCLRLCVPEVHYFASGLGTTLFAAAGVVTHLTTITQGAGHNQRTGQEVTPIKMTFNLVFHYNAAGGATMQRAFIVCAHNDLAGVNLVVTNLLATATPLSHRNHYHMKEYLVLYDSGVQYLLATERSVFARTITLPKIPRFNFNGADGDDFTTNALFLVTVTDSAANFPSFYASWELQFHG